MYVLNLGEKLKNYKLINYVKVNLPQKIKKMCANQSDFSSHMYIHEMKSFYVYHQW